MNTHVEKLLYEYLRGELSPEAARTVNEHLAVCKRCTKEVEQIRSLFILTDAMEKPSERRSTEFWERFEEKTEAAIRASRGLPRTSPLSLWETIRSLLTIRWKYVVAAGGLAIVLVCTAALLKWKAPASGNEVAERNENLQPTEQARSTNPRVSQYFRKSKMLFVGLTNMKLDDAGHIDFSTERKVSRQLVHEARYLKTQSLDEHSAQLIGDLEKILIELANMKEENDIPNVEIIRGGIHQENLLFKIRMAESLYDSASITKARQSD